MVLIHSGLSNICVIVTIVAALLSAAIIIFFHSLFPVASDLLFLNIIIIINSLVVCSL